VATLESWREAAQRISASKTKVNNAPLSLACAAKNKSHNGHQGSLSRIKLHPPRLMAGSESDSGLVDDDRYFLILSCALRNGGSEMGVNWLAP